MTVTFWEVKIPVLGSVNLNSKNVDGVSFIREKEKNFAIQRVQGNREQVIDLAFEKLNRVLDRLSLIYDEGLIASKDNIISNYFSGLKNSSVALLTLKLRKDDRFFDSDTSRLIEDFKGNDEVLGNLLGYYNKGLRSKKEDSFNAFLSFWGVVESYIRHTTGKKEVKRQDFVSFFQILEVNKKEADRLYKSYRSTIAHAGYDVSSTYDRNKVSSIIPRIQELAKQVIEKFLLTENERTN